MLKYVSFVLLKYYLDSVFTLKVRISSNSISALYDTVLNNGIISDVYVIKDN